MDLNYLRKLLKIFDESTVTELTIEEEGIKLQLSRKNEIKLPENGLMPMQAYPFIQPPQMQMPQTPQVIEPTRPSKPEITEKVEKETTVDTSKLHQIVSPIVGTFYRAPSPDSDPFVEVGTRVSPGTTLCIVEAMKLMNEIESDVAGTIEKIHVENGKPVEYNQVLFTIRLD